MILKLKKKIIYVREPPVFWHNTNKSLFRNPPKNLKFIFPKRKISKKNIQLNNKGEGVIKKVFKKLKSLKRKVNSLFNLPEIQIELPNKKFYFDYFLERYCLILSTKKVIIYGNVKSLLGNFRTGFKRLNSRLCLIILRTYLLSNRCKYFFCMSEASRKAAIKLLNIPKRKHYKFQVIYPTMKPSKYKKDKKKDDNLIRLLFIVRIKAKNKGSNFYKKGGKLVLQAYERLKSRDNNIELTYIGYVPQKFKEHYKKIPGIKFYSNLPYERVMDFYKQSDIFLFPTYCDNFGFTNIEAMAHGLPIIGINNHYASTELVINNKTGFLVDTSLKFLKYPFTKINPDWINKWDINIMKDDDLIGLNNFVEKLKILIQNKELREEFGKNGRKRLIDGDLSIKCRNRKLIYLFKE